MVVPGIGLRPIGDVTKLQPATASVVPYNNKGSPESDLLRKMKAASVVASPMATQASGQGVSPGIGLRSINDKANLNSYV